MSIYVDDIALGSILLLGSSPNVSLHSGSGRAGSVHCFWTAGLRARIATAAAKTFFAKCFTSDVTTFYLQAVLVPAKNVRSQNILFQCFQRTRLRV